jgi:hypothetical protein
LVDGVGTLALSLVAWLLADLSQCLWPHIYMNSKGKNCCISQSEFAKQFLDQSLLDVPRFAHPFIPLAKLTAFISALVCDPEVQVQYSSSMLRVCSPLLHPKGKDMVLPIRGCSICTRPCPRPSPTGPIRSSILVLRKSMLVTLPKQSILVLRKSMLVTLPKHPRQVLALFKANMNVGTTIERTDPPVSASDARVLSGKVKLNSYCCSHGACFGHGYSLESGTM